MPKHIGRKNGVLVDRNNNDAPFKGRLLRDLLPGDRHEHETDKGIKVFELKDVKSTSGGRIYYSQEVPNA